MTILYLLSVLSILLKVDAADYSRLCPLSESPIVQLEYDPNTRQFALVDDSKNNGGNRSLLDENVQLAKHKSSHTVRGATGRRVEEVKTLYAARQCPCDSVGVTYCLVDSAITTSHADTCGITNKGSVLFGVSNYPYSYSNSTGNSTIECFEMESQTIFIRNAWPVIVLWYGALVIFFLATANGKYAQLYLANMCCSCLRINERYVDRILEQETAARRADVIAEGPGRFLRRTHGMRLRRNLVSVQQLTEDERREQTMQRWIAAAEAFGLLNAREVSEWSQPHQPMEYVLKTRKFDKKKERARKNAAQYENQTEGEPASCNVTTPVKSRSNNNYDEEIGPATPETVATNASDETNNILQEETSQSNAEAIEEETDIVQESNGGASTDSDDDTYDCTICLSEVVDGEEVGVLTCSHIFHVDCLKEWMLRRNACPLCQTEICTLRPVENATSNDSGQDSSFDEPESSSNIESNISTQYGRPYLIFSSLPDQMPEMRDAEVRPMPQQNRPSLIMTSLPILETREPSIRRSMSGTMSSSNRNRRERGRARRQQIEDPFSFAGW